ncbi:MAG: DUF2298 domain-containing protein [Candidatus Promineifilaceae bacterium]
MTIEARPSPEALAPADARRPRAGRVLSARWLSALLVGLALGGIVLLGGYYRFIGLDWDATYHLHPDERFLTDVASLLRSSDFATYLSTSKSPLNPYNVGKPFYVYGNFPMTVTRLVAEGWDACWPREAAATCAFRYVNYDGIHLVGRWLSAALDLVTILFTILIGRQLYGTPVGLLGGLLMALAVLPIQQSHFFTMDNWAAAASTIAVYAAVTASQSARAIGWWLLFGLFLGLATASRINMAPLALVAPVAGLAWLAGRAGKGQAFGSLRHLRSRAWVDDGQIVLTGLLLAALAALITFRLAQPYAFADAAIVEATAAAEGRPPPGPLELRLKSIFSLNPQWRANMEEIQAQQSPDASFPPALQWTGRTPVLWPWTNLVLWGMGPAAGLMAWFGFGWALWRVLRGRPGAMAHLIPLAWTGVYFLFMATRWVKSIRYFLPIYPLLLLLAAWALVELWQKAGRNRSTRLVAAGTSLIVILASLAWAHAFSDIYRRPVTRVAASAWMLENVPSGATLLYAAGGEARQLQLPLRHYQFGAGQPPLFLNFVAPADGRVTGVRFNYLSDQAAADGNSGQDSLTVSLIDTGTAQEMSRIGRNLELGPEREAALFDLPDVPIRAGASYSLLAEASAESAFSAGTSILANENWDDPLPVRYEGLDPYLNYYDGVSLGPLPAPFPDSEDKRASMVNWLDEADYVVLSSQRAVWSVPRLPTTFPLSIRYYQGLFSGELGYDLAAQFHADLHVGPLYISDTAAELGWGAPPQPGWPPPGELAAEEAFSVYDHPPVWLFSKGNDYDPQQVREYLGQVDLSRQIVMTPGQATEAPNGLMLDSEIWQRQQSLGSFDRLFNPDGLLARAPWLTAAVWWLALMALGWLAFPLAFVAFRPLPDRAYPLARLLALLLIALFAWLPASFGVAAHTRTGLALALLALAAAGGATAFLTRQRLRAFLRARWRYLLVAEALAFGLYALFLLIRLGNPDVWDVIWGGEKPMDMAYFTAVMKSVTFPPYDPWFAGGYINYYYYGFVVVGALTKLLAIEPALAYNLIVPTLFSLTGVGAFSLAANLAQSADAGPAGRTLGRRALAAGIIACALAVLLGNLGEVGVLVSAWQSAADTAFQSGFGPLDGLVRAADGALALATGARPAALYPGDWFWRASRAISAPPGEVQPITEFPFFTFLYADLHAHMIALPVTLLALAWAAGAVLRPGGPASGGRPGRLAAAGLSLLLGAVVIGSLRGINTWDFPTHLGLGAAGVAVWAWRAGGASLNLRAAAAGLAAAGLFVGLAVLLYLPYAQHYGSAYASFSAWAGSRTSVGDYLVIYGLFLALIVPFLLLEFRRWAGGWSAAALASWQPLALPLFVGLAMFVALLALLVWRGYYIAPLTLSLGLLSALLAVRPGQAAARRVGLALIAVALLLSLVVEVVVLDGDIGRMNTVFKFYLQVWVMLSVAGGVAAVAVWSALRMRLGLRRSWLLALGLPLLAAGLYPLLATKAKWDVRMSHEAPLTLDGMAFMPFTSYIDTALDGSAVTIPLAYDYEALRWMQANVSGSPVVAEAIGANPYRSIAGRVAMYTGLPAIVGWDWHQRQQRAVLPAAVVSQRIQDVNTLYGTADPDMAAAILEEYDVGYVYVGRLEAAYYPSGGLLKFEAMAKAGRLREVYRNAGTVIYEVSEATLASS